jgi:hypothetical protein
MLQRLNYSRKKQQSTSHRGQIYLMRAFIIAATLAASLSFGAAVAQTPAPATAAATHYTTGATDIGTLLDDPAAREVIDKHLPGFSSGDQINMARALTLKSLQQYVPDRFTDQVLAEIDADLAKLPAKK